MVDGRRWARPSGVFDREYEWATLGDLVGDHAVGARLGFVYGRRRQGKTLLLESVVEAAGGLLLPGLEQSAAQNRAAVGAAYARHRQLGAPVAFAGWKDAIDELLALGEGRAEAVPVVLDEFPYFMAASPELPSVIQAALSPRGRAKTRSRVRLILCGSASRSWNGCWTR